jgi:hypothetical protein
MFFRKKKQLFDDEQKRKFADAIAGMLETQLTCTGKRLSIEDGAGHLNRKAIGYIRGYTCCALRSKGFDDSDPSISVPIIFHILRRLFPSREAAYMKFLIDHQRDELVLFGDVAGGQQFADFMKPDRQGDVPMGLARFITESAAKDIPDKKRGDV